MLERGIEEVKQRQGGAHSRTTRTFPPRSGSVAYRTRVVGTKRGGYEIHNNPSGGAFPWEPSDKV
jgi:hypothetical protein